uniref:Sulfotransferase n=1 Tax=Setaria italica TaxID=4555 RepID=K3YN39_SETIT
MAMSCNRFGKEEATVASEGDELTLTPEIVASLPKGPHCPAFLGIHQYRGFWIPDSTLLLLQRVHAAFESRPTDILLLKALAFTTLRRTAHSPLDGGAAGHPLLSTTSHDLVKFIDTLQFLDDVDDGNTAPRLLSTHLTYSLLDRDTLVTLWHFESHMQLEARFQPSLPTADGGGSFEEAFERYYWGQCGLGPRRPGHVLCLRYEVLLRDTVGSLRTMAEFMGCPFSAAEEAAGVPRARHSRAV